MTSGGGGGPATPPPGTAPMARAEEEAERRKFGGGGRPDITIPSQQPDPVAKPMGRPERWSASDDEATVRGRRRENEAAVVLAQHGYAVLQNPLFAAVKNPDFQIEGKIFDNFSPDRQTSVRNIWSTARRKVRTGQTRRVIINLEDSMVDLGKLRKQFSDWHILNLEEVIAVRDREVHQIFPIADAGGEIDVD